MTMYSLDLLFSQFWTSPLFCVWFELLLLDLHTGFSKAGKVVWYSHHLKNFPQFVVIHTIIGFRVVSKAEVDVLLINISEKFPLLFLWSNGGWQFDNTKLSLSHHFGFSLNILWYASQISGLCSCTMVELCSCHYSICCLLIISL